MSDTSVREQEGAQRLVEAGDRQALLAQQGERRLQDLERVDHGDLHPVLPAALELTGRGDQWDLVAVRKATALQPVTALRSTSADRGLNGHVNSPMLDTSEHEWSGVVDVPMERGSECSEYLTRLH